MLDPRLALISKKIHYLRQAFGYTQQQVADYTNQSRRQIQRVESMERSPKIDFLLSYSEMLAIPLSEFFDTANPIFPMYSSQKNTSYELIDLFIELEKLASVKNLAMQFKKILSSDEIDNEAYTEFSLKDYVSYLSPGFQRMSGIFSDRVHLYDTMEQNDIEVSSRRIIESKMENYSLVTKDLVNGKEVVMFSFMNTDLDSHKTRSVSLDISRFIDFKETILAPNLNQIKIPPSEYFQKGEAQRP